MNTFVLCNISKNYLQQSTCDVPTSLFFFLIPLDIRNRVALACFIIASVLFWIFWREASFMLSSRCILKLRRHPRVATSRVTCVVGHQSKCLAIHLLGCSIPQLMWLAVCIFFSPVSLSLQKFPGTYPKCSLFLLRDLSSYKFKKTVLQFLLCTDSRFHPCSDWKRLF